jgi:hypothetical protein
MVVWTSSLVAVNAAAGHPGTTDAQHSTCRVPQCHQCVPEQTSTTHRPKRPLVFQPTQRPHAALCCMRKHSTHPSTSTVLSALCLRQRAPQHQHPHHIVYKSSPSASTTVPAPPKHTRPVPDLCRVVERPPRRHLSPPPASHRKGVLTPPLFLNPLTPQAPPPMALSALSAKPCAASAPSSKVRAPAQTGSGASKTPPDRIQRDTWRCETSRQPPHGGVTRAADHLLHARTAHARGSTRCYWARDPASVPRTRTVRIVFPVVD